MLHRKKAQKNVKQQIQNEEKCASNEEINLNSSFIEIQLDAFAELLIDHFLNSTHDKKQD
jgi:hypothetical protein